MAGKVQTREPQSFGKYVVLGNIGRGGCGSVYKGRDPDTGQLVAIKALKPEIAADPRLLARFEQEFLATRTIVSPHIVRALAFGQENEVPYLVMEFVEGEDLGGRITTRGRLPEPEAVAVIAQVAQGLHHAHERGVVHRDVKPDNILLLPDGRAKLADFGLVKDLESDLNLTETATVLGTPNFMAPEQFENSKKVDRRADVYALAATLYMAVTGELPFHARGYLSTMRKKLAGELTAPRQLVPELSEHLEAVILRAMALDPAQRPATCQAFAEELAARPEAPPAPAPARPSRPTLARRQETFKGRDRRNATRFPCNLESSCLPIGGEADKPWKARIKDISARGIGLLMSRRFVPGTVLLLELQGEPRPLGPSRLLVRVMRVREQSGRQWLVGCQLAYKLCPSELQGLQSAVADGKAVPFWLMTQPETLTGTPTSANTPTAK